MAATIDFGAPAGVAASPLSDDFGVDVTGLDLARLGSHRDEEQVRWIRRMLKERLILRFRQQKLTQQQMVDFVGYFGPLAAVRTEGSTHDAIEGIKLITNERDPSGKSKGDPPPYELTWHTDGSYMKAPTAYTALYCITAPEIDPTRTCWMSMQTAFARLPLARRRALAGIRVLHYSPKNPTRHAPEGAPMVGNCRATEQPLVRVIPDTGIPALFIGSIPDTPLVVEGERWSQERSKAFLDQLIAEGLQSGGCWETALQDDDLVFWDNRAMAHKRDNIGPDVKRVLWHVAVAGEVPVPLDLTAVA